MFEQLNDTVGVEDMTTAKFGTGFSSELLRVADCAKFVLIGSFEVADLLSTLFINAG